MKPKITIDKSWLIDLMRNEERLSDKCRKIKKELRYLREQNETLIRDSIKHGAKKSGFGYLFV